MASKILESQGLEVTSLAFSSYFFGAEQAKKSAAKNDIKLAIRDISTAHLALVKNPCFARGAGMNPCVDCHLLMLKVAKKIAREAGYDFIATGEVLGQRPLSQNAAALKLVDQKANLEGKILRPLSAIALAETEVEKNGLVKRAELYGISGRSRKKQMELAKKMGVKNYPMPAGGCILTDKDYSKRLKKLLDKISAIKKSDVDLLRAGRNFWVGKTRIILGRNQAENLKLNKFSELGDLLVEPKNVPGPTVLVRGKRNKAVLNAVKKLLLKYAKKAGPDIELKITSGK